MLAYNVSSRDIGLNFSMRYQLHPYFVYASSKGAEETARMRMLVCYFAAGRCDKYQTLMDQCTR